MTKILLSRTFFHVLIIIKISQTTWQIVGYFNSSQPFPHNNSDLSISMKKNKTNPLSKRKRDTQSAFWKITIFLVFAQLYFKRLRHIFIPRYFANIIRTAASQTLWKQPPMCVLNSGNSKSHGKSPEIHFC